MDGRTDTVASSDAGCGAAAGTGGGSETSPAAPSAAARSFAIRVSRRIFIVTANASSFASTISRHSSSSVSMAKLTIPGASSRQSTVFGGLSDALASPTWSLLTVSDDPE